MKAIIIAGGYGERLRPITNTVPKPMIQVAGKPVLAHIIELFKKNCISDFILSLCYLPKVITSYFGNGSKFGVKIDYIFEDVNSPLGTAGAIASAKALIDDTFIVTYGDILRDLDIKKMIDFHKKMNSFATINVYKRESKNAKSMVVIDQKKRIVDFIERPNRDQLKRNFIWVNGSFYIFEPEVFNFIPDNKKTDFGSDIFPELLKSQKSLYSYPSKGYFIDIGNIEKLELARKTFKKLILL